MVAVQTANNGQSNPALAFSAGRHEGWSVPASPGDVISLFSPGR